MFTVVVVDDEHWALYGVVNTFEWERFGFKVIHSTCDSLEAWDKIREMKPDVVFADIRMPEMTGIELFSNIRSIGLDCEFVILSGYSEFEYARQAISLDVFEYLLKPINKNDANLLLEKLAKHIRKKCGIDKDHTTISNLNLSNPQFRQLVEYLHENYGELLHITKLAKKFYIDVSYCNRLFHANFGKSFTNYVIEIRMKKAREFLLEGMPVKEVAPKVGYSYNHFLKAYKKYYGNTVSDFAEGAESNENDS
ncbi:MAG: response regulator [Clostridiaceae bacterium]|jgi:two-component system response regulator YesN|nr:response regulator [Clostridiaceae bacterium]